MSTPLSEATAGAIGACIANTIVFPLDVVKTKLQVQTKVIDTPFHSTQDAILKILKKDGIKGLYAGLSTGLAGTLVSSFSYYFIYTTIRQKYQLSILNKQISTAMELTLGAVAGALCQFIVLPIGIVTTRQQTTSKDKSMIECVQEIIKEEGFTNLWKGLEASLVLCVNPAITFGLFERIKSTFKSKSITSTQAFLIDPYIMAKVRMQWKANPEQFKNLTQKQKELISYKSAIDILGKVYKQEGLRGWYTGLQAQIMKAVLSQAIVFAIKEKLSLYTTLIFISLRKNV